MVVSEPGRKIGRSRVPLVSATGRAGLVSATGTPILHQFGAASGNLFSAEPIASHSSISARLHVARTMAAAIASETTIFGNIEGSDASFSASHSAISAALAVDRPLAAAIASVSAISAALTVTELQSVSVVATGSDIAANTDTKTFAGVNFGPPHSTRRLILALAAFDDDVSDLNSDESATIGGIAATKNGFQNVKVDAAGDSYLACTFSAAVPLGTSGNIVFTLSGFSGSMDQYHFMLLSVIGYDSVDFFAGNGTVNNVSSTTLNRSAGGFVIGALSNGVTPRTVSPFSEVYSNAGATLFVDKDTPAATPATYTFSGNVVAPKLTAFSLA